MGHRKVTTYLVMLLVIILGCSQVMVKAAASDSPEVPRIDSVVPLEKQPHESDVDTIWYDDFNHGRKKYGEESGNLDSKQAFANTGKSMHCLYAKGSQGKGNRKVFFGDCPTGGDRVVRKGEKFDEIYFRLYVKHQRGWTGGHPAKLARATSMVTSGWAQAMIAHVWGGGGDVLTLDPATGVDGDTIVTTRYNDFPKLKWLGNRPASRYPISATSESGCWVPLECKVTLNTPGKSDGHNQLWIDGRLECERSNLNFRGSYDKHGINAVFLESYWNRGSPVTQSRWYDNFIISTKPIGPVVCPANPVLVKTSYYGPGKLAEWEVQLAGDFDGKDVVFKSKTLKQAKKVKINKGAGTFTGSLAGADKLADGNTYYARVRQKSTTGAWSDWSRWHQGFVASAADAAVKKKIKSETGLAANYPGDKGIEKNPAVIFASGFEEGFEGWSEYKKNISVIVKDTDIVHSGSTCLQSTATRGKDTGGDVVFRFPKPVDQLYLRFYCKFHKDTVMPHHFVKLRAIPRGFWPNAGKRPPGDKAFWTGIEPTSSRIWKFYTYWYKMHSWQNLDGTPDNPPDGDGRSFYGNNFTPDNQTPFEREQWICVEAMMKANTPGKSDGEMAFWIDGKKIGHWKPGSPIGTWVTDTFHTSGRYYKNPKPFEGFDFRSVDSVKLNQISLQWYVSERVAKRGKTNKNIVYFDDIVVATEYIGPRVMQ